MSAHVYYGVFATLVLFVLGVVLGRYVDPDHGGYVDRWLSKDKLEHFFISLTLVLMLYQIGYLPPPWAFCATLAGGAGYEFGQGMNGGFASYKDFTWDLAGALLGLAILYGTVMAVS